MEKKDRQHYVSQSFLRNFSPEYESYLKRRDSLDKKQKRKQKSVMKIHYFDIIKNITDYGNISKLAKANHYLSPVVDDIVKEIENKIPILRKVIESKSEDLHPARENRRTIWEIANCLKARSIVDKKFTEMFTLMQEGSLIDCKTKKKMGSLIYTKDGAEFLQTAFFTNDPRILIPLMLKAYKIELPSADAYGTFDQIYEEKELKESLFKDLTNFSEMTKRTLIPDTVYPILIENTTDLDFITGDVCVAKTEYLFLNKRTGIEYYYFPISPKLAILLLEEESQKGIFPRNIFQKVKVHQYNRLIYNCSYNYLFSYSKEALQTTTSEPKEKRKWEDIILGK